MKSKHEIQTREYEMMCTSIKTKVIKKRQKNGDCIYWEMWQIINKNNLK